MNFFWPHLQGGKIDFLGMSIDCSTLGEFHLHMTGFVDKLVKTMGVTTTAPTPATAQLFEIDETSPRLSAADAKLFYTGVYSAMWTVLRIHVLACLPVMFLTGRVQHSTEEDMHKLRHVVKYLNGVRNVGLTIRAAQNEYRLTCYADASYGVHADGKSHGGIIVCYGAQSGSPIYWKSYKQRIVARSSTEAEFITLSDATSVVVWLQQFLDHLYPERPLSPAIIYEDNTSAIRMALNGKSMSERTRHINIRYFFVKDYLAQGIIVLQHLRTELMLADALTKPLAHAKFMAFFYELMKRVIVI